MIKRFFYLGYYLKNLDTEKFRIFFSHVKSQKRISSFALMTDIIWSSLKYNISLLEYFQFHFYDLPMEDRRTFAGTGTMYEYQLVMNPKSTRQVLDDKIEFFRRYSPFIKHIAADIQTLKTDKTSKSALLNNASGKIVLKYSHGQCGWQVKILKADFFKNRDLIEYMEENGFDMAEEFIVQHPSLMELSPSAVNTVRIITQLTPNNDIEILGARLRISENSPVDNMASGNFAAAVDVHTGVINGPGVYSDITKGDVSLHPITNVPIIGFKIPFWSDIIALVNKAALLVPANKSIGWDVAVTEKGPELIEGNHDWCKLVWQLPIHKGLKPTLEHHLSEFHKKGTSK